MISRIRLWLSINRPDPCLLLEMYVFTLVRRRGVVCTTCIYKVFTWHLNVKCFESAVPAIFPSYAPTFFTYMINKQHKRVFGSLFLLERNKNCWKCFKNRYLMTNQIIFITFIIFFLTKIVENATLTTFTLIVAIYRFWLYALNIENGHPLFRGNQLSTCTNY